MPLIRCEWALSDGSARCRNQRENMAKNKKKKAETGVASEQLEDLIHEAMLHLGWVLPVTPEDVARIEAKLDEKAELPPTLRDPYALFDRETRTQPQPPLTLSNDDVVECLARVAREGKAIPPEIEARMRHDREHAERDADEGR